MLVMERVQHSLDELLRLGGIQMELTVLRPPGSIGAPEYNPVPFIQEHLRCTAGVIVAMVGQELIDKTQIADPRLGFVVYSPKSAI